MMRPAVRSRHRYRGETPSGDPVLRRLRRARRNALATVQRAVARRAAALARDDHRAARSALLVARRWRRRAQKALAKMRRRRRALASIDAHRPNEQLVMNVRNQSSRGGVKPDLIVLHDTESSDRDGAADLRAIGNWFDNPRSMVSAHVCVDGEGNSARYVPDE